MDPTATSPKLRSRAFSYRSDRSGGSKGNKEELVESPKDKERRDLFWKGTSKANPNAAINEAQPGDRAILESTTITSLRAVQHTDSQGNLITDPDLSNPTRPRLERPLDTIRNFEKQIDKGYKRRTSIRSESYDQNSGHSRRSSYFGGYDGASSPNRYSQVNGGGGGSYYNEQRQSQYGPGPSGPPRQRYGNRQMSDPMLYGQRPYQQHNHQQSQATMNTDATNGSDSTGPWANSTDPSSDNSSVERGQIAAKPNGEHPARMAAGMPPAPERRPIQLGKSDGIPAQLPVATKPEPAEKRKSWLKRRFSKNG